MHLNMFSRSAVAVFALAGLLAVGVSAAFAHTGIESTSPKRGARLDKPPARVSITFEEEIRGGTITVKAPDGTVVSKGKGGKNPVNVRQLRVALKRGIGSGTYTVGWRATSADGHEQRGTFRFTVR